MYNCPFHAFFKSNGLLGVVIWRPIRIELVIILEESWLVTLLTHVTSPTSLVSDLNGYSYVAMSPPFV